MSEKLILVMIAILAIALIVNVYFLLDDTPDASQDSQIAGQPESESQASITHSSSSSSLSSSSDNSDSESSSESDNLQQSSPQQSGCISKYNLSSSTVIFYNLDELHSNNMKPIVNELKSSYSFYWKNTTYDSEFNACLGFDGPTIPAFICAGTKQRLIGEVSKTRLAEFASLCA